MSLLRIGYIRVSTGSGEQLAALDNQRSRIAGVGVDRIIEDVQSGLEQDREGYLELLDLIDKRRVAEVVITRVDRLGRDAAETDAAIAFATQRGVRITALDGGEIETQTPGGFVMARILTTLAEMESRMLSQRIRAGLAERRKKHFPLRGRAPWGYQISADRTRFEPHPVEWARAKAFLQTLERLDWRMNTALDVWQAGGRGAIPLNSCRSVRAWLMNPVLQGGTGYHQVANHRYEEVVWGTHQPLIPRESFEAIERQLELNRRYWGHNVTIRPRLLTGLCKCTSCGRRMVYAGGRTIPSMLCKTRGCDQRYRSTHEALIRQAINRALCARAHAIASAVAEEPPELEELRLSVAQLEALNDPELAEVIAAKRARMQKLHNRPAVNQELAAQLRQGKFWESYTDPELMELYQLLVKEVQVTRQQVSQVLLKF